jgi:uncharacterized protein (DUF4415 family)
LKFRDGDPCGKAENLEGGGAEERKGRSVRKVFRKQARELAPLARMPDEQIDLTDAPEVRDWRGAVVGKFYRPIKRPVTIRVDADVLAWLKRQGRGYQTRINKLLREATEESGGGRRKRKSVEEKSETPHAKRRMSHLCKTKTAKVGHPESFRSASVPTRRWPN